MEQTQSESALLFCVLVKIVSYTSQNQKNAIFSVNKPWFFLHRFLRILRFQKNHELVFTERWQRPLRGYVLQTSTSATVKKESFGVVIVKEEGSEGKKNFHSSAAGGCHFLNLGFYCVFYCFSFLNSNFLATLGSFWQPCQFFLYIYISIYLSIYLYFLALVAKVAIRFSLFLKNL